MNTLKIFFMTALCLSTYSLSQADSIESETSAEVPTSFDIVKTQISITGTTVIFSMSVADNAGKSKPDLIGNVAGSDVFSYVWPTSINSYEVGFEKDAGLLALAVTAHPDFDDTPLFDENNDGIIDNDGNTWHSHWVVLSPNQQCGDDALAVVDIPKGMSVRLPKTWPNLPILLDSPGWQPIISERSVEVRVPFSNIEAITATMFDGVTAGLRINKSMHAPFLCVVNVTDIASGDLSLPGKIN